MVRPDRAAMRDTPPEARAPAPAPSPPCQTNASGTVRAPTPRPLPHTRPGVLPTAGSARLAGVKPRVAMLSA